MSDMTIADLEEVKYRVRAHDPITSVEAAEESLKFSKTQAGRILGALRALGTAGADQLAEATGMTVVQVDRRLPDLKRAQLAHVLQLNGEDVRRDGYRVWAPTQKNLPNDATGGSGQNKT